MRLTLLCFHRKGCGNCLCKWMAPLAGCSWLVFPEVEHLSGRKRCTQDLQAEEAGCQACRDLH